MSDYMMCTDKPQAIYIEIPMNDKQFNKALKEDLKRIKNQLLQARKNNWFMLNSLINKDTIMDKKFYSVRTYIWKDDNGCLRILDHRLIDHNKTGKQILDLINSGERKD